MGRLAGGRGRVSRTWAARGWHVGGPGSEGGMRAVRRHSYAHLRGSDTHGLRTPEACAISSLAAVVASLVFIPLSLGTLLLNLVLPLKASSARFCRAPTQ